MISVNYPCSEKGIKCPNDKRFLNNNKRMYCLISIFCEFSSFPFAIDFRCHSIMVRKDNLVISIFLNLWRLVLWPNMLICLRNRMFHVNLRMYDLLLAVVLCVCLEAQLVCSVVQYLCFVINLLSGCPLLLCSFLFRGMNVPQFV